jgi:ribosome-associated protein
MAKKSTQLTPKLINSALEEVKATNILVIPVAKLTSITDHMIICTATSDRHGKALARSVIDVAAQIGIHAKLEGEQDGEWILVDLGDAIVHIMLSKTRDYYNLEGLWLTDAD